MMHEEELKERLLDEEGLQAFLTRFHYGNEQAQEARRAWERIRAQLFPRLICFDGDGSPLGESYVNHNVTAQERPIPVTGILTLGAYPGERISALSAAGQLGDAYLMECLCSFYLLALYPLIPRHLHARTGLWMRGMRFPDNAELQRLGKKLALEETGISITPYGALLPACSVLFCTVLTDTPACSAPEKEQPAPASCEGCAASASCGMCDSAESLLPQRACAQVGEKPWTGNQF